MATVFLARQTGLKRLVALKRLNGVQLGDGNLAERFARESQLTAQLAHERIVTVHDYFEVDGTPFIAMEYLPGGSLRPHVRRLNHDQVPARQSGSALPRGRARGRRGHERLDRPACSPRTPASGSRTTQRRSSTCAGSRGRRRRARRARRRSRPASTRPGPNRAARRRIPSWSRRRRTRPASIRPSARWSRSRPCRRRGPAARPVRQRAHEPRLGRRGAGRHPAQELDVVVAARRAEDPQRRLQILPGGATALEPLRGVMYNGRGSEPAEITLGRRAGGGLR